MQTKEPPYRPAGSRYLSEIPENEIQQIRLTIQGYPGTGKTWAATTFPYNVFVNLDRGLGAHTGRADIIEVPLYREPKRREALDNFMKFEAPKLTKDQTLVLDGNTGIENAYHEWYSRNQVWSAKTGKLDEYAEWGLKVDFYEGLCEALKSLQCHVIYICHETAAKDKKTGEYTGKLRPLLTGQAGDRLMSHFTDFFRAHSADKKKDISEVTPEALVNWGMKTAKEYMEMQAQFPRNTIYFWQTESDNLFDGKCSSLLDFPRYIPANYQSLLKYMRKGVAPKPSA